MSSRVRENKNSRLKTANITQAGLRKAVYTAGGEDGPKRIISHASSTLNRTEQRYHINEIECLAIVWAIKKYRIYLEDRHFVLKTDNCALLWLNKQSSPNTNHYPLRTRHSMQAGSKKIATHPANTKVMESPK